MKKMLFCLLAAGCLYHTASAQAEVSLDLRAAPVSLETYTAEAESFTTVFHGEAAFRTDQTELVRYKELQKLAGNMNGAHAEQYFKGLRVFYGLSEENRIVLYYLPVYANYVSTSGDIASFELSNSTVDLDSVLLNQTDPVYYADNGYLFDVRKDGLVYDEALDNSARYKQYFQTYISYSEKQTSSTFFPFQEADSLHKENLLSVYSSWYIYFTSTTARQPDGKYGHAIIMSTLPPNTALISRPLPLNLFYSKAANNGHPCPTGCFLVNYAIE